MSEIGSITFGLKVPTKSGTSMMPKKTGAFIKSLKKKSLNTHMENSEVWEDLQKKLVMYNYKDFDWKKEPEESKKKYEEKKELCSRVPVFILSTDSFVQGRMCWPKSAKAKTSFCSNMGGYESKSDKALRYSGDGSPKKIVECNPKECPYVFAEKDENQKCKHYVRLSLHLDLPGSPSGLNFFTYRSHSAYTKNAMIAAFETIKKLTNGYISCIPMELLLTKETRMGVDQTGKEVVREIPVVRLVPRVSVREMIEISYDHAMKDIEMKKAMDAFNEKKDVMKFSEEDIASFEEEVDVVEAMEGIVIDEISPSDVYVPDPAEQGQDVLETEAGGDFDIEEPF